MNNVFKYAFFALTVASLVSGCSHRGTNPYSVKTQNKAVYTETPINRHIYTEKNYDAVTQIIDNDSNERIETIIGGHQ
jgi:hypothetical protein